MASTSCVPGGKDSFPGVTWDQLRDRLRPLVESAHSSVELERVLEYTAWLRQVGRERPCWCHALFHCDDPNPPSLTLSSTAARAACH